MCVSIYLVIFMLCINSTSVSMYAHMYICMYACMHVWMQVCLTQKRIYSLVCMFTTQYICFHVHTYALYVCLLHMNIQHTTQQAIRMNASKYTCTHMHTYAHTCTYIHAYLPRHCCTCCIVHKHVHLWKVARKIHCEGADGRLAAHVHLHRPYIF
jgi:hypothetical protein